MNEPGQKSDSTRMGQGMIAIGFVIGIALLTFMFDGLQQDMINPNVQPDSRLTDNGAVEVVLESNRSGHYVMRGQVNGVPADLLLDTGATDVVLPAGLAREAGLEQGPPSRAMTANGLINIYSTRIDELRLADIALHDVRASINPSMDEHIVLLGMSALRQIEFNQQGSTLTLRYYPD